MLRKIYLITAVTAALFISPAMAKHGHGHGHGHGHAHAHVYWNKDKDWDRGRVNWNAPMRGRWWGGRWYGYGEGGCWGWTPVGYVWICR